MSSRLYPAGFLVFTLLFATSIGASTAERSSSAADAGSGAKPLILPGFEALRLTESGIRLGEGRLYGWAGRVLPAEIKSHDRKIAGPMRLVIRSRGVEEPVQLTGSEVVEARDDRVEIRTRATAVRDLRIEIRTVVEYDGLGDVDILLTPARPVPIDSVALETAVVRQSDQQMLGYTPQNAYWSGQDKFLPDCYRGSYRNIVGFIGRDTGFWWLSDEGEQWLAGPELRTEIRCESQMLVLVQPIVSGPRTIGEPLHCHFAFLATPVRALPPEFRTTRIAVTPSREEARVGNLNLWWTDATAHFGLPYLDYPPGAREKITPGEIKAYPGEARNRERVQEWRNQGIERIPYMSLRAISPLDAEAQQHLPEWIREPQRTTDLAVDAPYTTAFKRPLVSLRASGYVEYELQRLGVIADRLNVRGFYFDQAGPIGSSNPAHAPRGSAGVVPPATDVLAMRGFFKRLATMLYEGGHAPLVYVHNSTSPIIPAYTFVTGMVQGEELNAIVRNFDYQASISTDYVWSLLAPQSSGIPTVWIEELWSEVLAAERPERYRKDVAGWLKSPEYYSAWRNFMSLALLHDIPVLTQIPVRHREDLYGRLDRFGVARSDFIGYWSTNRDWRHSAVLVSAYVRRAPPAALAIVANTNTKAEKISSAAIAAQLETAGVGGELQAEISHFRGRSTDFEIQPRDFTLVDIR